MPQHGLLARVLGAAGMVVIVAGLYFGQDFLVPLALALLFTFMLSPAVLLLQRAGLPRAVSSVIAVLVAFGLLFGMGVFVVDQVAGLAGRIPEYRENIRAKAETLNVPLANAIRKVQTAVDAARLPAPGPEPTRVVVVDRGRDTLLTIAAVVGPVVSRLATASVVILLALFFLIYQNEIRDRLVRLGGGHDRLTAASRTIEAAIHGISRFLFLQALLNVGYGIVFGAGMALLGVPNALLWGFTAALLRFVPYAGPIVAGLLPVILSIAIFPGWGRPALVAGFIVVLELVSNNLVEPVVYGKRTGLSPAAVVLAAVFWAWLWGPVGLLLSVPLTLCLMTVGKTVPGLEFLAVTLSDEPALTPELQTYNRLLAGHTAEAAEIIERETEGKPFAQVCDEVLVPALKRADEARHQGLMEEDRWRQIVESVVELQEDLVETSPPPPVPRNATVVCLAAGDRADEVAAGMLAQALTLAGFRAEVEAPGRVGSRIEGIERRGAEVVGIAVLAHGEATRAKYLVRRLRRRMPAKPIVVVAWSKIDDGIPGDDHTSVVSGVTEALRAIE